MFRQFMTWLTIGLLGFVILIHLVRMIYIVFKPGTLERFPSLSTAPPTPQMLFLYCLVMIVLSMQAIFHKLGIVWD